MGETPENEHLFKQRLAIVVVSYLIAFVFVGVKADFQLQIEWISLVIVVPVVLFGIVLPYLKNETIITGAVIGTKDHVSRYFFRVFWVFMSGIIFFIFIFGKHG